MEMRLNKGIKKIVLLTLLVVFISLTITIFISFINGNEEIKIDDVVIPQSDTFINNLYVNGSADLPLYSHTAYMWNETMEDIISVTATSGLANSAYFFHFGFQAYGNFVGNMTVYPMHETDGFGSSGEIRLYSRTTLTTGTPVLLASVSKTAGELSATLEDITLEKDKYYFIGQLNSGGTAEWRTTTVESRPTGKLINILTSNYVLTDLGVDQTGRTYAFSKLEFTQTKAQQNANYYTIYKDTIITDNETFETDLNAYDWKDTTQNIVNMNRIITRESVGSYPGVTIQGYRPTLLFDGKDIGGGYAFSIMKAQVSHTETSTPFTTGAVGVLGNTLAGNPTYMYFTSNKAGSYNNYATLKVTPDSKVGIALSTSTSPSYTLDVGGQINAVSSTFPVLGFTRKTTTISGGDLDTTTGLISAMELKSKTSLNMVDGFGGGIIFTNEDNTATEYMTRIYSRRDGADNEGALQFFTGTEGSDLTMTLRSSGFVGIGTHNPQNMLDVAGSMVIGSNLAGVNTAPTNGLLVEGNVTVLGKITSLGRVVDRTNNVLLNSVNVSNTVTETIIYNEPIYSNELDVGTILKIYMAGLVNTASASDSVTIRFKLNNVTKQTFTMIPKLVSDAGFHIEGTSTTRSTGSTGLRATHQQICIDDDCNHIGGLGTYDTTINQNLTITAQWNNAKTDNSLIILQGFMEFKN